MAAVVTASWRGAAAASSTFAILLGVSVGAPMLGLPQLVTGTFVNAALLVAVGLLGPRAAIALGILPSLVAVGSGQLAAPLVPLVPVIIVGNALLVVVFHALRRRGWTASVVAAAATKSCWLFGVTGLMVVGADLLPAPAAAVAVALTVMGWPQLVTALSGGALAYALLRPARRL